jgi:Holliday junction resolvasome RuvABC endonuclease subunit
VTRARHIMGSAAIAVTTPAIPVRPAAPIRVLGLDPGADIGWAILDVGTSTAEPVWTGTASARTDAEIKAAWHLLLEVIDTHHPRLVAIERVERVHGTPRMGSSYAQGLARAAWIGGGLCALVRSKGLEPVTVEAPVWRLELVGIRSATDREVKEMLSTRCPHWPARSNAHERDAAGVALFAGLAARRPS